MYIYHSGIIEHEKCVTKTKQSQYQTFRGSGTIEEVIPLERKIQMT